MPFVTTRDGLHLHVKDTGGSGRPVVLIHGWPLSGDMWEWQSLALIEAGHRVVTYDRRGFGQSSHPAGGYNYDVFADDLADVLDAGDIRDAMLVGFSMGTGEVARYLSRHGAGRIARTVLISSVIPYALRTPDNPDGVDEAVFEEMKRQVRSDRFGFLQEFGKLVYGVNLISKPVSQGVLDWSFQLAVMASPKATVDCIDAFGHTDFRPDLPAFTVPTLFIHGGADKTAPIDATARQAVKAITGARLVEYDGEPHCLFATAPQRLNGDLIGFAAS